MSGGRPELLWTVPATPGPSSPLIVAALTPKPGEQFLLKNALTSAGKHVEPSTFYGKISFDVVQTPLSKFGQSKRKRGASVTDENTAPDSSPLPFPLTSTVKRTKLTHRGTSDDPPAPQKRVAPRTDSQKIEAVLAAIKQQGWTFVDFLHNVFRAQDDAGKHTNRSQTHSQMVATFLGGRAKRTVSDILNAWMTSPDGRLSANSSDRTLMYSTGTPYTEVKSVRAALTAFAAQTPDPDVRIRMYNSVNWPSFNLDSRKLITADSKCQILIGTNGVAIGADIPNIATVLMVGDPETVDMFLQMGGRVDRNGRLVT